MTHDELLAILLEQPKNEYATDKTKDCILTAIDIKFAVIMFNEGLINDSR